MNTNYHHHPPSTRTSTGIVVNETADTTKKTSSSPRRQTTRSTSNLTTKDDPSSANIQIFKPVAVRPSSDAAQNSYNLRSRTKLKNANATEVIPSFTEKLSLDAPSSMTQQKPVPPLTRAAAASAGLKIDSLAVADDSTKVSSTSKFLHSSSQSNISTRSSTTRKRKASDDDHRPYLDLLKMKQVISYAFVFRFNSPARTHTKMMMLIIMMICCRVCRGVNVLLITVCELLRFFVPLLCAHAHTQLSTAHLSIIAHTQRRLIRLCSDEKDC